MDSQFFERSAIDPKQWVPYIGDSMGDPAIEAQSYRASQVDVVAATGLRLIASPQGAGARPYASGAVTSKGLFSQRYGHFEMKARMPQANGLWPAFWLLPADGTWPPEIDILEYIYAPNGVVPAESAAAANAGAAADPATTLHWKDAAGHHQQTAPMVGNDIAQPRTYRDWNTRGSPPGFHTYAVDWRPGSVTWMIDGAAVFCTIDTGLTGKRVPDVPMYLILNLAVSNGTKAAPAWAGYVEPDTPWPQSMDVAYIRVSQFKDLGDVPVASLPASAKPLGAATGQAVIEGKIGEAEAKVLTGLTAIDPGLCKSGAPADFASDAKGWTWKCIGAGGGGTDPTGLAFKAH